MNEVNFPLAFLAGVLSFLSPCVLPLIPSYISFITGVSFEGLKSEQNRKRVQFLVLTNSLAFIMGFSLVFISLGASSSLIGQWLFNYEDWIRIIGGILVIIFGVFIAGFLKLDFLMKEKKFHLHGRPAGYIGTLLVGIAFAAGWTPCIGPMLGSILLVASSKGSTLYGIKLLAVYSIGMGIPFLISALAFNWFLSYSMIFMRHMRAVKIISGLILIAFGFLLLTDNVSTLSALFPDPGIDI
jgi:cytochrome c-type biogenesis protein